LPNGFALAGITDMAAENRSLLIEFLHASNRCFAVAGAEAGRAFFPWIATNLAEILWVHEERIVADGDTVRYQGRRLQIAPDAHRPWLNPDTRRTRPFGHATTWSSPQKPWGAKDSWRAAETSAGRRTGQIARTT
jgi:hypothetical protein